jgi:hypothetical protein
MIHALKTKGAGGRGKRASRGRAASLIGVGQQAGEDAGGSRGAFGHSRPAAPARRGAPGGLRWAYEHQYPVEFGKTWPQVLGLGFVVVPQALQSQ